MSGTAPQVRAGTGRPSVVAAILVLVLLAPVAFLFTQAYGSVGDRRAATEREIEGVAYLRALGQLAFTTADAQSAAVAQRQVDRDAINAAMAQVDAADERHGDTLRTHERWAEVRSRLNNARDAPPATSENAYAAYREIAELMLALFGKVRDASGLAHDPDADAYQLQEGVATYLPAAVIAAGRLADLAVLAPTRPADQQFNTQSDLALARVMLITSSNRLIEGLRSAADDTESRTLGGNLLTGLDNFQLATEQIISVAGLAGQPVSDPSVIRPKQGALRDTGDVLSKTILNEVDRLLKDRQDDLGRERLVLSATGLLILLLALVAIVVLVLGWRSSRAADARTRVGGPPDDRPVWGPTRAEELARRERAGAAR